MRNLLRCRRGTAAFATVIALVPLIGAVSLGGEATSWYVTKQHTQNAADAAAYAGALNLECTLAGTYCPVPDTQTVAYRGKEFAAQNGYCNAGDTSYPLSKCATALPPNTSQTVSISTLTTWNGKSGNFVQATVQQTQPAYLAVVLGLTTVNIFSQATAQVNSSPKTPCALALTGSFSFQGSANVNAPGCDIASNDPANNALNFTGGGISLGTPPPSLSATGGCTGAATYCGSAQTYQGPATDPFSALDSALTTLCGANPGSDATCGLSTTGACAISKKNPTPIAYTAATPCANNNVTLNGMTAVPLSAGVYFISGTLTMTGGSSITGTGVTLILLPGASIDTKGGGTVTISAPTSAPATSSLPSAFQSDASLFLGMALYDASSSAAQFGGTSNINITGNIYAPTAAVTFQGDPVLNLGNGNQCGELIAASIAFNGNATFDDSGCAAAGIPVPIAQYVQLVAP
jgi:putative Flp pilus-assembly TadE/G-like protein